MATSSHDIPGFGQVTPRLLLGFGLALFGVVLLLGQLDILDAHAALRYWPILLIAIGVVQFFNGRVGTSGERRFPVHAVIWMAVGGVLLLNSIGILRVSIWELFWPAILIALGLRLMTHQGRLRLNDSGTTTASATSGDIGPIFSVLSGVKRVSAPQPFPGAEVTMFMGGAQLDLRQAILRPGDEAVLDVFAVMGGCELLIPTQWVVSAPIIAIMGGVEDKRLPMAQAVIVDAGASPGAPPRLVIKGVVLMGGVTIRS
jgi:predicted membrane protein